MPLIFCPQLFNFKSMLFLYPSQEAKSMKQTIFSGLTALFLSTLAVPGMAADWAWVMSIPHAISPENVYKVRILEIDGTAQKELIRYAVPGGTHRLTLELMLDVEWEPDLTDSVSVSSVKQWELEVEAGKTYLLGARVNVNAPAESQLDQSYWEPFVYRASPD
jgi:hypothetical protein